VAKAQGHGERLSRKQEQAVGALLANPTIVAAAEAVGVSERTIREWLKLPCFAAAFREARRQVVEAAIARVQQLTGKATEALDAALDSADAKVKVRAAALVLSHAVKGVDTADMLARLEEMERQLAELTRGKDDAAAGSSTEDGQIGDGAAAADAGEGFSPADDEPP
jgi:hypothetical protein